MVLGAGNKELSVCGAMGLGVRACVSVCVCDPAPTRGGRGPSHPTGVCAQAAGGQGVQVLAAVCRGPMAAQAGCESHSKACPLRGLPGSHIALICACVCARTPG